MYEFGYLIRGGITMRRLKFRFALFVGKTIMTLSKILPGVSGTTWPGGIANIIDKNFAKNFRFKSDARIVMVTGTSGKTTTTGMLAQLVESEGKKICTNAIGANMDRGISTTFIKNSDMSGNVDADYIVLEVDERYLPLMTKQVKPHVILVTNILKDQSQRNGEPGVIMKKVSSAISDDIHLILNRDEPNTTSFGVGKKSVSYYGVADERVTDANTEDKNAITSPFSVACSCPVCGGTITYDYENILNIGKFKCNKCNLKSEENAVIVNSDKKNMTINSLDKSYKVKYISNDFLYCYASLLAFAKHEGFSDKSIQQSINDFKIQSGRVEKMKVGDKTINYLRIKQETPVTLQSAINVATADDEEKIVVLDLSEIVDFSPHYTGMYYAYDCDFGKFKNNNVIKYICMSNVVCYDAATRLALEGVDTKDIVVLPTDNYDLLLKELEKYECKNVYLLTWMHSYYSCLNSVEKYNKVKG